MHSSRTSLHTGPPRSPLRRLFSTIVADRGASIGPMAHHAFDMTGLLTPPATRTRELLFEFRIHHGTVACELRYHGEWGVEARFVESDGHIGLHQVFQTRALAVEWAEEEQRAMERTA
jgi:hypothetical protein